MSNLTLYSAEENLQAFMETEEGGVPAELQEEFALALAGANELALDKRDNCIRFIRHVESQIEFAKAEKARINDWQKSLEGGLDRFREYLVRVVSMHGKQPKGAAKLEGRVGTLTLRKKPDTVNVEDEAAVPADFKAVTVTLPAEMWKFILQQMPGLANHPASESIDKKRLLSELKAGREVPGAELLFGEDTLVVK